MLLFRLSSFNQSVPSLAPTVQKEHGRSIPGTVEMLQLDGAEPYAIFRFDSPLSVEGSYVVSNLGPFPPVSFSKGGPFDDTPLAPELDGVQGIQLEPQDQRCCVGTVSALLPPGMAPCLAVTSLQLASVHVIVKLAHDDSSSRQYLYRASLTAPEPTESAGWAPALDAATNGWTLATKEPADELCYRVAGYRLIDGEQSVIGEGCAPAPAGPLGLTGPSDQDVTAAFDLRRCLEPPQGFTNAWCEANRAACADPSAQNPSRMICDEAKFDSVCASHRHDGESLAALVERGDEAIDAADAGSPSTTTKDAGALTPTGAASEGSAGTAASSIDDSPHDCSTAPRSSTQRHGTPWLLLLSALLLTARRVRRRASPHQA